MKNDMTQQHITLVAQQVHQHKINVKVHTETETG